MCVVLRIFLWNFSAPKPTDIRWFQFTLHLFFQRNHGLSNPLRATVSGL